ncbi:SLATT domain-containing protein [Peribacillus sp. FSL M8-0224]|uniref:SLATT domain-containing protein n=1 Tax=Peribacillus sp. FSL M8-0224 TaxID=2921568 RepID=UPI0030FC6A9A
MGEKDSLLKNIAETGYAIGFGGKKHFMTYDLYRIFPRLISCITIFIGIMQLTNIYKETVHTNVGDVISAVLIIVGILGLVLDFHGDNKDQYEVAGKKLHSLFNELRTMYNEVKYTEEIDLAPYKVRLKEIQKESEIGISKQAIGTHIITHFGFFQVMQSKWVTEELKLTTKDKFPFLHWESFCLYLFGILIIIFTVTTFR